MGRVPRPASPDDFASELKRGRIAAGLSQAHLGADFDFLRGGSGSAVTRDSH